MHHPDLPKQVAIIPDGNRRWAKEKGLPVIEGHRRGSDVLIKLIEKAKKLDIKVFTFWAFSTENWTRTKREVDNLMHLFERGIDDYLNRTLKNKIRFIHIGRKDRLPPSLKNKIAEAETKTAHFSEYYFVLALDYGGRDEVSRAVEKYGNKFYRFLDTRNIPYPDPDLIIRTSGEMRTSGFMIWQVAYAELMFVKKYFPDFTPEDLEKCIGEYVKRQRRFGR